MGINCTLLPDDKNQVSFIKKLKEKSTKKNLIIFDTGGKSTAGSRMAMAVANLVIIPYCYSSLDSRGLEETLSTIEELKAYGADPKFKVLLSKIDSRTSAHVYGIKELEQRGLPHFNFCIGNYRSINENMTVLDTNDEKAKACIQQLIRAIDKELFGK
jgi:cellulose biosynthesis protein BcsQ